MMHPKLRLSKPGKCPMCNMNLTPAAFGGTKAKPAGGEMMNMHDGDADEGHDMHGGHM